MSHPKAFLKKERKKRTENGHPWIFAGEIQNVEAGAIEGGLVDVATHHGKYLATGYWNPASQISIRVISWSPVADMDKAFFVERLERCKEHRQRFVKDEDCRLVYGEADGLPGLIVDRFGSVLVVQLLTLGIDRRRDELTEALVEVFSPEGIYERSDVGVRKLEGLQEITGVLYGQCPASVEIRENGLKLEVDIAEGQKTGYFYDQRENRAALEPLMTGWGSRSGISLGEHPDAEGERVPLNANGKIVTYPYWDGATVLECFAHTGSFTLHACKYGAKRVTCLDISEHALETARRNVELNGFEDRVEFVAADAFHYLREQVKGLEDRAARAAGKTDTSSKFSGQGRTWDVVILDPPAFAKSKGAVAGAARGYKDINLHGMKLVNEGGYLVTASCSYHMSPELFRDAIAAAAADAGKVLRLVEWRAAGKDHPQLLDMREGHYLKFGIFEVRSK